MKDRVVYLVMAAAIVMTVTICTTIPLLPASPEFWR